jgi:predicted SnoaL-like aldol condensation-catalyzing enzyme
MMAILATPALAAPSHIEATRAVAGPFLEQMFVKNDVNGAYHAFAAPDFIQHNPNMADGLAGHDAYFDAMAKQARGRPSNWAHVFDMVLVDGDLIAVYHHVFHSPEDHGTVFVDIWRVAGGKIVEHWDVIQPIPPTSLNGNGMACGAAKDYASALALGDTLAHPTCGLPDPRASRQRSLDVIAAYVKEVGSRDVVGAIRRWFSPDYRQHSPTIPDGAEGAIAYLEHEFGKEVKQTPTAGPARVIAEGDFVMFHRLVTYPGRAEPSSNIDVFRVTDGKISEHWDVKQPVPKTSANGHGMW